MELVETWSLEQWMEIRHSLLCFFRKHASADAEDLAQQTLLIVWVQRAKFAAAKNRRGYIFGIAHNLACESYSHLINRSVAFPAVASPYTEDLFQALDECLGRCTPEERQVLRCYFEAGQDQEASRRNLAQSLGVSQGTLRVRVYRIIKRVRIDLNRRLETGAL